LPISLRSCNHCQKSANIITSPSNGGRIGWFISLLFSKFKG
jgi:hypothetical protein